MKHNSLRRIVVLPIIWILSGLFISLFAQQARTKIICYNILEGMVKDTTSGKQQFSDWVRNQQADIIGLQEVNRFTRKTLSAVADSYGHPYTNLCKETGYPPALTSKTPMSGRFRISKGMWHGFAMAEINGYRVMSLHLSPHQYQSRWNDIDFILQTIQATGKFEKWIIMGDFNSVSPLDRKKYENGKYLDQLKNDEKRHPTHQNTKDDQLDYNVHQKILNFGFVDALRAVPGFSEEWYNHRIDFIYVSPDLKNKIIDGGIITDDFTRKFSDHKPLYIILQ